MVREATIEKYMLFLGEVKEMQRSGKAISQNIFIKNHVAKIRKDLIPNLTNVEVTKTIAKKMASIVNSYINNRHNLGYLMEMVKEIEMECSVQEIPAEQTLPTEILVKELIRRGYAVTLRM